MSINSTRHERCRLHLGVAIVVMWLLVALRPTPVAAQEKFELSSSGWDAQTAPEPSTPAGQLQQIRRKLAMRENKKARKLADQWIKDHPDHPLEPEAYLLRGDAKKAGRDYYKALYDYEHVIRTYQGTDAYHLAVEREYEIAKLFAAGTKRKLWGMPIVGAFGEAEELFIRTQERVPGSALGEMASIELGDFFYRRAKMTSAVDAYEMFLLNYPRSEFREHAMLRLIHANLATFKGPRFDARGLIEASLRLRQFMDEFPASARAIDAGALLVRIEEMFARKSYLEALWYEGRGQEVSAVYLYRRLVHDYAQTVAAENAMARLTALDEPISEEVGEP